MKKIGNLEKAIEFAKTGFINKLLEDLKTDNGNIKIVPSEYMDCYEEIQIAADLGEIESGKLFNFHNETIEKYIIECKNKLIEESKTNLIDGFLKYTNKINFFIFWMNRIFCYLDRFYNKINNTSLSKKEMELYKSIFFEEFKDNIQEEINKIKNEGNNENDGLNTKYKNIMKIQKEMELKDPVIFRDNYGTKEIKWIEKKKNY